MVLIVIGMVLPKFTPMEIVGKQKSWLQGL